MKALQSLQQAFAVHDALLAYADAARILQNANLETMREVMNAGIDVADLNFPLGNAGVYITKRFANDIASVFGVKEIW